MDELITGFIIAGGVTMIAVTPLSVGTFVELIIERKEPNDDLIFLWFKGLTCLLLLALGLYILGFVVLRITGG